MKTERPTTSARRLTACWWRSAMQKICTCCAPVSNLIPAAGGPNAPRALLMARALGPEAKITALYVADRRLGQAEVLMGQARLDIMVNNLSPADREVVKTEVIQAPSAVDGILEATESEQDVLILGAGNEGPVGRFLFGDVPQAILDQSQIPVMVVRRRLSILGMGLSIVLGDPRFFWQAATTTLRGVLLAIAMGYGVGRIVPGAETTAQIQAMATPSILHLSVALAAGTAAAYAISRKEVSAALAGVAVAASLTPPLVNIGIALAFPDLNMVWGACLKGHSWS